MPSSWNLSSYTECYTYSELSFEETAKEIEVFFGLCSVVVILPVLITWETAWGSTQQMFYSWAWMELVRLHVSTG